jgi:SpoVK/Ycf46/Vps4 family AAA+-type ATPase
MQQQLIPYLRAGYAGLAVITAEEARAEAEIAATCAKLGRNLSAWSSSEGLVDTSERRAQPCVDPLEALQLIGPKFADESPRHVIVMRDLQLHLEQTDPMLVRRLKDLLRLAKTNGHALILLGCRLRLPAELDHEITRIDFALPGPPELGSVLNGIVESAKLTSPEEDEREDILHAALGLTTIEAENVFALSVVESGKLDPGIISREKARTLKRNGLVEVIETKPSLDAIGGLDNLKQWLETRKLAFSAEAKEFGLPAPKGLLIVGIPGTGKSLTAKATATAFGIPLLRLDMGKVFGGIIGQSEANLRSVTQTAEAIAPCVLWIDEIEKGFSGTKSSGSTDGGTTARVFGSFLSWMQEKEKPVFVVATANDVTKLPPEFVRKGRFDEMFFVDIPTAIERGMIWQVVVKKHWRKPTDFDCVELARVTEQFTGAEMEAVFVEAMFTAFSENRTPKLRDVSRAALDTRPIIHQMDTEIARLRDWARGRAREAGGDDPAPRKRSRRRFEEN